MIDIDDGTPVTDPSGQTWRRRLLAVGTLAALATGVVGFAVGRATGSEDGAGSDAAAATETEATDAPPATAAPLPAAGADGDAGSSTTAMAQESAEPTAASDDIAAASGEGAARAGGQYYGGAYEEVPQELVAERTTPDGVSLRAHLQQYDGAEGDPYGGVFAGWSPAAWCFAGGQFRVTVSSPSVVQVAWAPWYREPKDGFAVSTFAAGHVESAPLFGAIAQVSADVQSVTLTTSDGRSDTALVDGGIALLAVPGPIADDFTVTRTGDLVAAEPVSATDLVEAYDSREYRDACEPPPPVLPPAGEQPADVAAAEAALRDSWRLARPAASDQETAAGYIDDATGVREAWDALAAGQYADAAASSTVTIVELVFTSPTEAWFRYDIETSITDFPDRYGRAVLGEDGVWRITRQTICQDLALAPGSACTPAVEPLLPPSAAGDPRYIPVAPVPEGALSD